MGNPHTAPLASLIELVDDLETRLTTDRAGYLVNLNNTELLNIPDLSTLTATIISYLDNAELLNIPDLSTLTVAQIAKISNLDKAISALNDVALADIVGFFGYSHGTVALFQTTPATGTAHASEEINDNVTVDTFYCEAVGEYCEIDLGGIYIITRYRHFDSNSNDGSGYWKIQYKLDGVWTDWITDIPTRATNDWSDWVNGSVIKTQYLRVVATTLDTKSTPDKTYCGEWEITGV